MVMTRKTLSPLQVVPMIWVSSTFVILQRMFVIPAITPCRLRRMRQSRAMKQAPLWGVAFRAQAISMTTGEDLLISTCTDRTDTSGFAVALYGQETNLLAGDYSINNSTGLTEGNGAVAIEFTGVFEGSGSIDTAGLQDQFGSYLGSFGDLDGDGFDDIGFGAPGALSTDQGSAYLLYGDSNPYDL